MGGDCHPPKDNFTIPLLKDMLRERGLSLRGNKAELMDRIDHAVLAESKIDVAQYWQTTAPEDCHFDKIRDNELRGYPTPLLKAMLKQRGVDYPVHKDHLAFKDILLELVMDEEAKECAPDGRIFFSFSN